MSEFRSIRALIVDPSRYSRAFLKSLLANLGVIGAETVATTDEGLLALRTDVFGIVFCDELAGPLDPLLFLKALRRDLMTRDVTVPVVLVSRGAHSLMIKTARDCGMNDVIAKPVSVGTIARKLRSLLLDPRPFVITKEFIGPDRRRPSNERRQFGEQHRAGKERRRTAVAEHVVSVGSRLDPDDPKL